MSWWGLELMTAAHFLGSESLCLSNCNVTFSAVRSSLAQPMQDYQHQESMKGNKKFLLWPSLSDASTMSCFKKENVPKEAKLALRTIVVEPVRTWSQSELF